MKRLFPIFSAFIAIVATIGCTSSNIPEPISSVRDTFPAHEWESLATKIRNNDILVPEEWTVIFDNIGRADGGCAEDMGYSLFTALKGNLWYNDMLASNLRDIEPARREEILGQMVQMMYLDIKSADTQYIWLSFIVDFPVFIGSDAARMALEYIDTIDIY